MAYITRIKIDACRNVRQLDIDLSVPPPESGPNGTPSTQRPGFRHLILTGPNGSGKSGVLEAIAQEIAGLAATPVQLSLFDFGQQQIEWTRDTSALRDELASGDAVSVYLKARRTIRLRSVRGPTKRLHVSEGARAGELGQFLVNKHVEMAYAIVKGDRHAVDRIQSWFAAFEGNLRKLMEDDALALEFDSSSYNFRIKKSDGYVFDLRTLADGHAAVVAILAELLIRIDGIQQDRHDFTFEPQGVVIIDEVETHLHLSLQEQILPFLTELFPRLQFLVATHSPAVIASIPNAIVYDLRKREAALSDHYRGLRYGTLMTEHFGISSEIDLDSTEKLLRVRHLAALSSRTAEEELQLQDLTAVLTSRSPVLAVELWMITRRPGAPHSGAAAE